MLLKYNIDIDNEAVRSSLNRLTNQIYKLLPTREEGGDWQRPLETIIEEIAGMKRLLTKNGSIEFFRLLCKLEGLFTLEQEKDFMLYRSIIFDCLGLIGGIQLCL